MKRPIIAITMGDPAGIGPEVAVKAFADFQIKKIARCFVVGDLSSLSQAIKLSKLSLTLNPIKDIEDAKFNYKKIDVISPSKTDLSKIKLGQVSAECGRASIDYIEKAISLVKAKQVEAIVTGPINKEAIQKAGFKFDGHTEILAKRTKTKKYAMAFVSPKTLQSKEFWM